jgi:hypothetical protein
MEMHRNLKPCPPGVSGNPNGRPVGSRSAFSAGFTRDLAEVWADKGKAAMLYTAEKKPAVFFATCARLLPNDVRVTVEQQLPGNLSMEDWQVMKEIIAAVRQAIPDASSKPPGAVLEHVLGALQAVEAKIINCSENEPSSDSSDSHNATLRADLACAAPQK